MRSTVSLWFDHWFNKYAVIALCAAFGLFGYEWICWSELTPGDWGTWVAAIGTVGTLIGTVWLATAEGRNRRNDNFLSAQLHAASMRWRLATTYAHLSTAVEQLRKVEIETTVEKRTLVELLLSDVKLFSISELLPLVPLRGNMAGDLAQANDQVELVKLTLNKTHRMPTPEAIENIRWATDALETAATLFKRSAEAARAAAAELNNRPL